MNKTTKQVALFLLVGILLMYLLAGNDQTAEGSKEIPYTKFISQVKSGTVSQIYIENGKKIVGSYASTQIKKPQDKGISRFFTNQKEKFDFTTKVPYPDPVLMDTLMKHNIKVEGRENDGRTPLTWFFEFLPYILIIGFIWFFMFRQIQSTGNKAMSFGKSKAKMTPETKKNVTFKDVAGAEEAKDDVKEIVDFLKDPKKFLDIGARIPTGVLLTGPPGTGKTLLARAISGEASVPFFSISGSDFVEMFVGVGASRVRDLFEQGKKNAPCIIFIDEIDAVGRLRGAGLGGGHDEREQTLNQLLVEMDGFEKNEGVIIVAATNRPDVLDPALLRPGRFDRQVIVDLPDVRGREKILAVHSKKVPLAKDVELKTIARGTPGFTGADLANLINEGALLAARNNRKRIDMNDLEHAKDKVMMGPERKSMLITDKEKEATAYHEAGHAIVGVLTGGDPIHKVTIIPRGRALGLTMQLPTEEKHSYSKSYLMNRIKVLYGGHIAEDIQYGETTTGVSNDLEQATNFARKMICEWGMNDQIGLVKYGDQNEQVFLGREISQHKDFSEATAKKIDEEVFKLTESCRNEARKMILDNIDKFNAIAKNLIERETLNAEDMDKLMNGEELTPLKNGDE